LVIVAVDNRHCRIHRGSAYHVFCFPTSRTTTVEAKRREFQERITFCKHVGTLIVENIPITLKAPARREDERIRAVSSRNLTRILGVSLEMAKHIGIALVVMFAMIVLFWLIDGTTDFLGSRPPSAPTRREVVQTAVT
jgi:hypothetical protein